MSIVRQYGNTLINLTKVISVKQTKKSISFTMPLSNWFSGGKDWLNDTQSYQVNFTNEIDAINEIELIKNTLNEYYTQK